jgi:hypothetical protein
MTPGASRRLAACVFFFRNLPLCGRGKGRGAVGGASQSQRQTTGVDEQQPREAPSLASAAFAWLRYSATDMPECCFARQARVEPEPRESLDPVLRIEAIRELLTLAG